MQALLQKEIKTLIFITSIKSDLFNNNLKTGYETGGDRLRNQHLQPVDSRY